MDRDVPRRNTQRALSDRDGGGAVGPVFVRAYTRFVPLATKKRLDPGRGSATLTRNDGGMDNRDFRRDEIIPSKFCISFHAAHYSLHLRAKAAEGSAWNKIFVNICPGYIIDAMFRVMKIYIT